MVLPCKYAVKKNSLIFVSTQSTYYHSFARMASKTTGACLSACNN